MKILTVQAVHYDKKPLEDQMPFNNLVINVNFRNQAMVCSNYQDSQIKFLLSKCPCPLEQIILKSRYYIVH